MRIWLLIACNWVVERMWIIIVCALVSLFNNEHFVITQFSSSPLFSSSSSRHNIEQISQFSPGTTFFPSPQRSRREWMEKYQISICPLKRERFFFNVDAQENRIQRERASSGENENLRKSFGSWKIQLFSFPLRLSLIHVCTHYFFLFLGKIKFKSLKMHEMSSTLFPHIYTWRAQHSTRECSYSQSAIDKTSEYESLKNCWRSNWKFR